MQKFIISIKGKATGHDVVPPYIVNSLDGLGKYSERMSSSCYRDWETDRKSTRLNSSHRSLSRMPSSA